MVVETIVIIERDTFVAEDIQAILSDRYPNARYHVFADMDEASAVASLLQTPLLAVTAIGDQANSHGVVELLKENPMAAVIAIDVEQEMDRTVLPRTWQHVTKPFTHDMLAHAALQAVAAISGRACRS